MQIGFHLDMVRCDQEPGQPLHIFKIPHCSIFDSGAFEFGLGDIGKINALKKNWRGRIVVTLACKPVFGRSLSVAVVDHTRIRHQLSHGS